MPDNPKTRDSVLFPEIDPYQHGRLAVDPPHSLYWETCGRAAGVPVVYLHGGPGGGCLPFHRRFFDPSFWRIVLFDQRGAGTLDADRRDRAQYHAAPRRRHGSAAPAPRHRALAGVRRLVGRDAGARVRGGASGTLPRARAARRVPRAASRARLVHSRDAQRVSRSVARLRRIPSGNGTRRPPRQLSPPADRSAIPRSTFRRRTRGTATKARARRCCRREAPR